MSATIKPAAEYITSNEAICEENMTEKGDWADWLESSIKGMRVTDVYVTTRKAAHDKCPQGIDCDDSNEGDSAVVIEGPVNRVVLLGHSAPDFDNDVKVNVLSYDNSDKKVNGVSIEGISTYWFKQGTEGGEYYTVKIDRYKAPILIEVLTYSDSLGDVTVPHVVVQDAR